MRLNEAFFRGYVEPILEKRGVKTQYLEVPGAPPVIYGEIPAANATRTVIFYAHYDGQPLDPASVAAVVVRAIDEIDTSEERRNALPSDLMAVAWGSVVAQSQ